MPYEFETSAARDRRRPIAAAACFRSPSARRNSYVARGFVAFRRSDHFELNVAQYCEQVNRLLRTARVRAALILVSIDRIVLRDALATLQSHHAASTAAAAVLITTVGDELIVIGALPPPSFNREHRPPAAQTPLQNIRGGTIQRIVAQGEPWPPLPLGHDASYSVAARVRTLASTIRGQHPRRRDLRESKAAPPHASRCPTFDRASSLRQIRNRSNDPRPRRDHRRALSRPIPPRRPLPIIGLLEPISQSPSTRAIANNPSLEQQPCFKRLLVLQQANPSPKLATILSWQAILSAARAIRTLSRATFGSIAAQNRIG